jgi:hypothetical protein
MLPISALQRHAGRRIHWTEQADTLLRRLRAEGSPLDVIAETLGVSRNAVQERCSRISARFAPRTDAKHRSEPEADPAREPLCAGHPTAWSILTAGTLLEGIAYPSPDRTGAI